jgi:hypothetical protein
MNRKIIDIAIDNLNCQPNIQAKWLDNGEGDGALKLVINGKEYYYNIEVKKDLRQYQVVLINEIRKQVDNVIIIAEQIYPRIKEQLKELKIPYLEINGNFFLQTDDCFCLIDTKKKVPLRKEKTNRAFTKTGLKVIFHLLNDPELINRKQREIADVAGVALGNVPLVLNGLKETGYLLNLRKDVYVLEKKEELINRWVNGYATELRPKLIVGKYAIREKWQEINLDRNKTVWGGEPAADILTKHLRPEKFLVYTKERNVDLIKNYKFIPKEDGELEILEMFWENTSNEIIAPPLLIYAELMITGGKRNIETAQLVYDDYIKPKL